jgi:uncharacterized protein (DUF3084 family)
VRVDPDDFAPPDLEAVARFVPEDRDEVERVEPDDFAPPDDRDAVARFVPEDRDEVARFVPADRDEVERDLADERDDVERVVPAERDVVREPLEREVERLPRRSEAGSSSVATAFVNCGSSFCRNAAMRSSCLRNSRASFSVSLSPTVLASVSIAT